MITTVEEFIESKEMVYEEMIKLEREKIPYNKNIEIGLMIEVPSAIIQADILAKHADFFSVGTNDLVQYILAVDRISEKIADLYNPLNISVIRMLKEIVEKSKIYNIPLSICGEIAGEPQFIMLLLGLGFRHFSMGPAYMNQVKKIIRSVSIFECEELIDNVLKLTTTKEIENLVYSTFEEKFKDLSY